MKRLSIFIVALALVSGCAGQANLPANRGGLRQATPAPQPAESRSELSQVPDKEKDIPTLFRTIDFKNFTYPINLKPKSIRLKDGKYEYQERGDIGGNSYEIEGIDYADLDGDGNSEAIVRVSQVICGGSCDGSSQLFYFYSTEHRKLKLLSRIETGSVAYTCGLKSFALSQRTLALEVFRRCSFDGISLKSKYDADATGGKFIAKEFTRFMFKFQGRRFILKQRELLPNPDNDVKNYPVKISISND